VDDGLLDRVVGRLGPQNEGGFDQGMRTPTAREGLGGYPRSPQLLAKPIEDHVAVVVALLEHGEKPVRAFEGLMGGGDAGLGDTGGPACIPPPSSKASSNSNAWAAVALAMAAAGAAQVSAVPITTAGPVADVARRKARTASSPSSPTPPIVTATTSSRLARRCLSVPASS